MRENYYPVFPCWPNIGTDYYYGLNMLEDCWLVFDEKMFVTALVDGCAVLAKKFGFWFYRLKIDCCCYCGGAKEDYYWVVYYGLKKEFYCWDPTKAFGLFAL